MLSFFPHPSTFKVLAIWFQDFFLYLVFIIIPSLQYRGGRISPPPQYFFFSISSGVRFAMVMISDDGGKTLLILPISLLGMLALKCPWTVLTWAKSGLLIGSAQKIASRKHQSRIQSYFCIFC